MTDRLYYTDPYCREFDASVQRVDTVDGRTLVTLDRTAFYPTSGGQPFDTGTIDGSRVIDVVDAEDGSIEHVVESPEAAGPVGTLTPGRKVRGTIDWPRRFDHMQQHTGQHVLSAAIDRLFGVRTVSFHLGAEVSTIDLARELSTGELTSAETEANRIVWEDHPVSIRFADAEEAARLPLRKESRRDGSLRLIDIDGFDLSACGGTHVARTGAIGIIAVGSWERFKGGQRIEFLCGSRALGRFRSMRSTVESGMRLLSVSAHEIGESIERLQSEAKEQRRAIASLNTELARFRAAEIADAAEPTASGRLVLRSLDADANTLKSLAMAIAARPGYFVVLLSTGAPALVVIARSGGVGPAANEVLSALTSKYGGRGGGKADLAQGGGLNGSPAAILEAARAAIVG